MSGEEEENAAELKIGDGTSLSLSLLGFLLSASEFNTFSCFRLILILPDFGVGIGCWLFEVDHHLAFEFIVQIEKKYYKFKVFFVFFVFFFLFWIMKVDNEF